MAPPERPTIIQIPFSHYCKKVTWAMDAADIPYDVVNVSLMKMRRASEFNPVEETVPVLHTADDRLIAGSGAILEWLHGLAPDAGLFPSEHDDEVRQWQAWADEEIGPVTRREAYRVAYQHPWRFQAPFVVRPLLRLNRALILGVLKLYKVRRFDEHDQQAVPAILSRIARAVEASPSGFLVTSHATAADYAVAALVADLARTAAVRGLPDNPDWPIVMDYVAKVRPSQRARVKARRIKESDFINYRALSAQQREALEAAV